jgi:H+/gluconate symporter-like permease
MVSAFGIIILYFIIAILMFMRKIPTVLALPILAIGIAAIGGVPLVDGKDTGLLTGVIENGVVKLAPAYISVIFGAWLGQIMNQTGISKTMVKTAAELGGDRPLIVIGFLSTAVALLFTTLSGLGATIMIASIVLPIFLSLGIPPLTAVCIYLFSEAIGLAVNLSNWQLYTKVSGVPLDTVQTFALSLAGATAVMLIMFVIIEFKRQGIRLAWARPVESAIENQTHKVPKIALLTPLVPLVMVLAFDWPVISSFLVGILFCIVTTQRQMKSAIQMLTKTVYDGISDSGPAVMLMIGIGMILEAVNDPHVTAHISPLVKHIVPTTRIEFILFFTLLAPLALYRGPLNIWGLGSGLAGLFVGLNIIPPAAVMAGLLSVERVQVIGDPTNTHNVWLSNYVGVDVNQVLRRVIPYIWVLALFGSCLASFFYMK